MANRKNRALKKWGTIGIVVVAVAAIGWFSFGPKKQAPRKTVTIGIVGETKQEQTIWQSVAKTAKKRYGITLKTKNFTDYNQPNKALNSGDIDLNAFQHYAFLKAWNQANHGNLIAIGKTYIAPIRLYSKKYHSLSALPKGATIAIPNDASNESRALFVLKNAGLIGLKPGKTIVSIADITTNKKNLKLKEVSAEQTGRLITSVDAAVVNNDYIGPVGLGDKQTIYVEPINKDSAQWINIIVARHQDQHKTLYKDVVKAYQTPQTKRLYQKFYGKKQLSAWDVNLK